MTNAETSSCRDDLDLDAAADRAARAIPPLWPLASSVAVNPFLGQTGESLATVDARLERVAGAPVTMPRGWYQERIASGAITDADLSDALASGQSALRPSDLAALKAIAQVSKPKISAAPTIADLAAEAFLDQHHVRLAALAAHPCELCADVLQRVGAAQRQGPGQSAYIVGEHAELGALQSDRFGGGRRTRKRRRHGDRRQIHHSPLLVLRTGTGGHYLASRCWGDPRR